MTDSQLCLTPFFLLMWNVLTIFLVYKMINYDNSYMSSFIIRKIAQVTFAEKPQLKIISFQNYKHWYFIHNSSAQAFRLPLWIGMCHFYTLILKFLMIIKKKRFLNRLDFIPCHFFSDGSKMFNECWWNHFFQNNLDINLIYPNLTKAEGRGIIPHIVLMF